MDKTNELNKVLEDIPPLIRSYELFDKSASALSKKDWTWGDLVISLLAGVNFGYNVLKTAEDTKQFLNGESKPKAIKEEVSPVTKLLYGQPFNNNFLVNFQVTPIKTL